MKLYILLALHALCSAALGSTGSHVARRASSSSAIVAQLRELISEEAGLKQRLSDRVAALRRGAGQFNASYVPCVCPTAIPRKPPGPSIAFTGTLTNYKSSLTAGTTLVSYKTDLINIAEPYNATSGHFVANVSGIYAFSVAMFMHPGYWTAIDLVKNGSPIVFARTGHYLRTTPSRIDRQVNMATNFAIEKLNAGDEVWPRFKSGSSSNLWGEGVTTFTGVLLREI